MLKDNLRHCDICNREITKGSRYLVHKIEKQDIPRAVDIRTQSVDADGNVLLDLCLVCRTKIGLRGRKRSVDSRWTRIAHSIIRSLLGQPNECPHDGALPGAPPLPPPQQSGLNP
jgi:hypothetical protein